MIITIDGPAASGKSSTARAVAQQLGFKHINSGLLYRTVAYLLLQDGAQVEDLAQPDERAAVTFLNPHFLIYGWDAQGNATVAYNYLVEEESTAQMRTEDITRYLKGPIIDQGASIVSTNPLVRMAVVAHIRWLAQNHAIVIDGRDCGSVIFPQAELKIFLTAPVAVRAQRWHKELAQRGEEISISQAVAALEQRDERDATRAVAPLVVPQDALVIDNGQLTLQQTVEMIVDAAQERIKK